MALQLQGRTYSWSVQLSPFARTLYLGCYQVLTATNDDRAAALLQRARSQLQRRTAMLTTADERDLFWSAPLHAVVMID